MYSRRMQEPAGCRSKNILQLGGGSETVCRPYAAYGRALIVTQRHSGRQQLYFIDRTAVVSCRNWWGVAQANATPEKRDLRFAMAAGGRRRETGRHATGVLRYGGRRDATASYQAQQRIDRITATKPCSITSFDATVSRYFRPKSLGLYTATRGSGSSSSTSVRQPSIATLISFVFLQTYLWK